MGSVMIWGSNSLDGGSMQEQDHSLEHLWASLWQQTAIGKNFPDDRPLIAHYCSISTMESVLKNQQIWLSNPLLMNDIEEVRFGVLVSRERYQSHEGLKAALKGLDKYEIFISYLESFFDDFSKNGALDVYIACFSKHSAEDNDGQLSMWRGYGANGNGAAIVFDTSKLKEVPESPLIIGKVDYATREQRIEWIDSIIDIFSRLFVARNISDAELRAAALLLFERLLTFSLFTKHSGFHEEREWRVVYMGHRDSKKLLVNMIGYHIGPRGVEPKLKLELQPIDGGVDDTASLDNLVHKIILGPTAASELHKKSVERMLEHMGRSELLDRLVASTIPYRAV